MNAYFRGLTIALPLLLVPAGFALSPATAQFARSPGGQFLEAVRGSKFTDIYDALNKAGATIVNTRDYSSRETALHIVVKRGGSDDAQLALLLLQRGADANLPDVEGNTPLMAAIISGNVEIVPLLLKAKSNVNLSNKSGETPLIIAVKNRNPQLARLLLDAGADPDRTDHSDKSARKYAEDDVRTPALGKLFADLPKPQQRAVYGPKL